MGKIKDFISNMDKGLKMMIIAALGIVIIIVGASLIARVVEKKEGNYEETELLIAQAAQKYLEDNPIYLPKEAGESVEISLNSLVVNGYIDSLDKLLKKGDDCTARIVVTSKGETYTYVAYLDCKDVYTSVELYNRILQDNAITTKGVGLYEQYGEKIFKGEVKNNYVLLNENLWRILRIDEDNNVVLMSYFRTDTTKWDDRYNINTTSNEGINNYNLSRIKERIEKEYYEGLLFTDEEKNSILLSDWCLGTRGSTEKGNMKEVECKELSEEKSPIGLLTTYEYISASLDSGCDDISDVSCMNYNYMHDMSSSFWTITKSNKGSNYVYYVSSSGVRESKTNGTRQARYVIKLIPSTRYLLGSGTEEDPYKIR